MERKALKERAKERRKQARDTAAYLFEIISDNVGTLKPERSLAPSKMRIGDLQAFRILFKRLSRLSPHVNRYFYMNSVNARKQRRTALAQPDVYAQLAKLGLKLSLTRAPSQFEPLRNGTKPKDECKHGSFMYSAGVLYCSKCGVPAKEEPVSLAPLHTALPDYEVWQGIELI